MYTIRINEYNELMLYRHEDATADIHQLCQDFIHQFDEGNGGEYILRSDNSAVIAFY